MRWQNHKKLKTKEGYSHGVVMAWKRDSIDLLPPSQKASNARLRLLKVCVTNNKENIKALQYWPYGTGHWWTLTKGR